MISEYQPRRTLAAIRGPWSSISGQGIRISVAPDGTPWVVNKQNRVYRCEDKSAGMQAPWSRIEGSAVDIGIGANGAVWIVATGGNVYAWVNSEWERHTVPDMVTVANIAVDPNGLPWITTANKEIYRMLSGTCCALICCSSLVCALQTRRPLPRARNLLPLRLRPPLLSPLQALRRRRRLDVL